MEDSRMLSRPLVQASGTFHREWEKRLWRIEDRFGVGLFEFEFEVTMRLLWAYVPHLGRKVQPGDRDWGDLHNELKTDALIMSEISENGSAME